MAVMEQPQHMLALGNANRVRLARAEWKRSVKVDTDGRMRSPEEQIGVVCLAIMAPPRELETLPVMEALMTMHRWGRTRCRRLLASVPMTETKQLGGMTSRQRAALCARLRGQEVDDPWMRAAFPPAA